MNGFSCLKFYKNGRKKKPNVEEAYKILSKKYKYKKGTDTWVTDINGTHYEFCIDEKPGEIFIIDVCQYYADNRLN